MDRPGGSGPRVLVVEDDRAIARLVRIALETEGSDVTSVDTLAGARAQFAPDLTAVVLDRQLPDGDGLGLLAEVRGACPDARIILHTTLDEEPPEGVDRIAKGDVAALVDVLGLRQSAFTDRRLAIVDVIDGERRAIEEEWQELCRWDPMLPPDSVPAVPGPLLAALASALQRPQPLGWGPDLVVEEAADVFAAEAGSIDVAIEQLVCLREALMRRLVGRLPYDELDESFARLHMVIDRAIGVAAQRATSRLQSEAITDELTELLNRRALERNLQREFKRASRYGRTFSVVVLDVDGLKLVNDTHGHLAGDDLLRTFAHALAEELRAGDSAYRLGGDEFALLLPETTGAQAEALVDRIAFGAAPFGWGSATFPGDGRTPEELVAAADQRLYQRRSRQR